MATKNDFNPHAYQAFLFDMDGVLTQTASVHATCWKKMFDHFLKEYGEKHHLNLEPFTIESDYKNYVDGKPRYDGVRSFLSSRNIELPEEAEGDDYSIKKLGDQKNELIHEVLQNEGVQVYEGTIAFAKYLKDKGKKLGVVSSSNNCEEVLKVAGIEDLFDTRVDGTVVREQNLTGKPAPDMFLLAAKNLDVSPERAVVIEDAISGVQAGANGKFGLVIGINHEGDFETLKQHGAHFVTSDLGVFIP